MSMLTVPIEIEPEDAALLSEAYRYSQFYPDSRGYIELPTSVRAALKRVLDQIDAAVNPTE